MPLADIQKTRREKLRMLSKEGIVPYPALSSRTHSIRETLENFEKFQSERTPLVLAGRLMLKREHGGSTFFQFRDGSGTIQGYAKRDALGERPYRQFLELIDSGDIIEVAGTLFTTRKGERTIEAAKVRILAKSVRPLPEKWHGLQDTEERYRKRYLDLIANPTAQERLLVRSRLLGALREFLAGNGFVEVETPLLHPIPGGALAKPFRTHLEALNLDLYLRVAPELYLKRLLVGGLDAVFEIGRCFRNEGLDKDHNPEFTMCEAYAAWRDYEWLMGFTEHLFAHLVQEVQPSGRLTLTFAGQEINFNTPWKRLEFNETLKAHTGLDFWKNSEGDFQDKIRHLGLVIEKKPTKAALADELFKKVVRPKLHQPTFIIDYPVELSPLAKNHREDPRKVERFQLIAGEIELANAFTELNDPEEQRQRFLAQEAERSRGDTEAHRLDEEYLEALEYGMPPAAGIGIGIDRLARLLGDAPSLREVIVFPTMRPRSPQPTQI